MESLTGRDSQDDAARLDQLRADFPEFDIVREIMRDRIRYVSRRRHPDIQPHTVITGDLAELRVALSAPGLGGHSGGSAPGSSGG